MPFVVLCTFVVSEFQSLAAPRTVAILNLSDSPDAAKVTAKARRALQRQRDLQGIIAGNLSRALEDPLPSEDPDVLVLARVDDTLETADLAFQGFKTREATKLLLSARSELLQLRPTQATANLLADVSFHLALVHLRDDNRGLAMGEFQLVHRLQPDRAELDPVRFAPDIIHQYRAAKTNSNQDRNSTLSISSTYDNAEVFLDGVQVGRSPVTLSVRPGAHIVTVTAPQFQVKGRRILVDPNSHLELPFDLIPLSPSQRAQQLRLRARKRLATHDFTNPDDAVIEAAWATTRLVGADAVLVVVNDENTQVDSAPSVALFHPQLGRLSFRHKATDSIANLFDLLKATPQPALVVLNEQPTTETPWYLKPWSVAAIGAALAVAVVQAFTLGSNEEAKPDRILIPQCDFCL